MGHRNDWQLAPGITISAAGEATVDPSAGEALLDVAEALEDRTGLPVDVQHVLAALVLVGRRGHLDSNRRISSDDPALLEQLTPPVREIFAHYGGRVSRED